MRRGGDGVEGRGRGGRIITMVSDFGEPAPPKTQFGGHPPEFPQPRWTLEWGLSRKKTPASRFNKMATLRHGAMSTPDGSLMEPR